MTSRKEFEAHIRKQFPTASDDLLLGRSSNGRYGSMVTEHAWLAWQASALSAPEAEPYAWHYTNNGGASVWHMGPSNRFDADMQASKDYPRAHRMVPLYLHPSAPVWP